MFRIFLQETYEIIDGMFYDDGVSGTATYNPIRSTKTVDSTGTLLTATGANAHLVFVNNLKRYTLPFILEFDLLSTSNNARIDLYDDSTETWIDITSTGHVVIEAKNGSVTATCDGTPLTISSNTPSAPSRVSFYLGNINDSLKFKNAVVYPI